MSHVDALADLITYLNRNDFADRPDADSNRQPLHACTTGIKAHFAGFTLGTHFQPIVALDCDTVVAHEALLHVAAPAGVAPLFEEFAPESLLSLTGTGAGIIYLDRLARTLHALNFLLQDAPPADARAAGHALHLNVHPQHLLAVDSDHGEVFEGILRQCGLAPDSIVLEVREHAIAAKDRLADAIAAWQSRGYRIAIDNFGEREAHIEKSLALRPDLIKIDRALLHESAGRRHRTLQLQADVERARERGVRVVAVGIETPLQLVTARQIGADCAQGYLLGRPQEYCQHTDAALARREY